MPKAHPEHALQVKLNQWQREHIPQPHFFASVSRQQKTAQFTHNREKMAGQVAGMPDTILQCPNKPIIAVELKAPGNKPTDAQEAVGAAIIAAGGCWGWTTTVEGYARFISECGIQLTNWAWLAAANADAILESAAIRRDETKTGKPSRKRVLKPSLAQVRRVAKVRGRVLF
jgi:hypothetical protein